MRRAENNGQAMSFRDYFWKNASWKENTTTLSGGVVKANSDTIIGAGWQICVSCRRRVWILTFVRHIIESRTYNKCFE